jgi:hypothetical protein
LSFVSGSTGYSFATLADGEASSTNLGGGGTFKNNSVKRSARDSWITSEKISKRPLKNAACYIHRHYGSIHSHCETRY